MVTASSSGSKSFTVSGPSAAPPFLQTDSEEGSPIPAISLGAPSRSKPDLTPEKVMKANLIPLTALEHHPKLEPQCVTFGAAKMRNTAEKQMPGVAPRASIPISFCLIIS
jgi:hypothetical protein